MACFLKLTFNIIVVGIIGQSFLMCCTTEDQSPLQKKLIEYYIKTAFNVQPPERFTVENVCSIYQSTNLVANIYETANLIRTQVNQKDSKQYYNALKHCEEQLRYVVRLENCNSMLPEYIKSIKTYCTLPINAETKSAILQELWYKHWRSLLPSDSLFEDKNYTFILEHFINQCTQAKKCNFSEQPTPFKMCNYLKERFRYLKNEIENGQHQEITNHDSAVQSCQKIINVLNVLSKEDAFSQKYLANKSQPKKQVAAVLSALVVEELIVFWDTYWANLNYADKQQSIITGLQDRIHAIFI